MALLDYLNKPNPASMAEVVEPAIPKDHTVSEIRPVTSPQPNYVDEIGKKGLYGFFKDYYKKTDYEAEERRTRRERSLSLLGDIAKIGGQTISSSTGARQFAPLNSQVPKYNERLQQLRDAKRANDADYQNKSLSMIFKDYEEKRTNDLYERQQEAAKVSMEFKYKRDMTLKQIDQAFKLGTLDAKRKQALEQQAMKARDAKALAFIAHKYKLEEIGAQAANDKQKEEKKTETQKKYPKLRLEGPNGASQYYDINDDVQVAKMYNEAVRAGYFKPSISGERPTVKQMRDVIVGSTNLWKDGDSGGLATGKPLGIGWNEEKNNGKSLGLNW